jgi:hypothetical protein
MLFHTEATGSACMWLANKRWRRLLKRAKKYFHFFFTSCHDWGMLWRRMIWLGGWFRRV